MGNSTRPSNQCQNPTPGKHLVTDQLGRTCGSVAAVASTPGGTKQHCSREHCFSCCLQPSTASSRSSQAAAHSRTSSGQRSLWTVGLNAGPNPRARHTRTPTGISQQNIPTERASRKTGCTHTAREHWQPKPGLRGPSPWERGVVGTVALTASCVVRFGSTPHRALPGGLFGNAAWNTSKSHLKKKRGWCFGRL